MKMPNTILFFSDPFYMFLLLILIIILFHVYFIFFVGLKDVGWKVVDYFWLSFAALTIFSMAYQIRFEWYEKDIEIAKLMKENKFNNLKNKAKNSVENEMCLGERTLKKDDERYLACSYFKELAKEVIEADSGRNVGFLAFIEDMKIKNMRDSLSEKELLEEFDSLVKAHHDFLLHLNQYKNSKSLVGKNDIEKIFIFTSPLFFILALALRITKVTGEILLKTHPGFIGILSVKLKKLREKIMHKLKRNKVFKMAFSGVSEK